MSKSKKKKKDIIELVKLFNRMSYYLCYPSKNDNIEITEDMTVKELHDKLNKFYKENQKKS